VAGFVLSGVYSVARVLCEELAVEGAILNRLKNMVILDFSVPARSARVRAILRIQSNKGSEMRWRYLSIWPGDKHYCKEVDLEGFFFWSGNADDENPSGARVEISTRISGT